ncbi:oxygen-independent coproporphyrinogen III oxidase [Undibacter mobilis]|uniref:Coproporphyrinogen-III oxidase n=1 Tax=Undibacter mobilis TaxID=2292256 RepID=A0A371BC73_9BRAD|nr:oxygen-independent coproporphyrinogen III oxidase [Undibacter mobilis]RDV05162.1 oxygen-independent coproporphyrinogen III oxidase [Undibacter mobilis]
MGSAAEIRLLNGALALAERNVPRYTSYPSAPHFSAAVGPADYRTWLDALPRGARLSLYIHVPFCTELCFYCGCNTRAVRRPEPVDAYAEDLIAELKLLGALNGARLTHLHWGGGTPSILGPQWLETIAAQIASQFDLSALHEHAIELDPRRIDHAVVATLKTIGVNRASLGMQDASEHVQHAIGRVQPFEQVAHAAELLREAGIANLNLDLMYGLPKQSAADVARSAELACSLEPQRLALFGYAHVPWFKTHQRLIDAATLPGAAERLEQARVAAEVFASFGYEAVGLDHFALPEDELFIAASEGRLRRNFQGYTTDDADALIGVGASSIGKLPQGFVQNAPDTAGYARSIKRGTFATVKGLALSDDDILRASIIERLMCDLALDLDRFGGAAGFENEMTALADLASQGLVTMNGARIAVTEAGRPFIRIVAAVFDTYLAAAQKRHSIAV